MSNAEGKGELPGLSKLSLRLVRQMLKILSFKVMNIMPLTVNIGNLQEIKVVLSSKSKNTL